MPKKQKGNDRDAALAQLSWATRVLKISAVSPLLIFLQAKLPNGQTFSMPFEGNRSPEHDGRWLWHEIVGYNVEPPANFEAMMDFLLYGCPKGRYALSYYYQHIWTPQIQSY